MIAFTSNPKLRDACKTALLVGPDIDPNNMPMATDLSDFELLELGTICLQIEGELSFITNGDHHNDILLRMCVAFNSLDSDDTQDLVDYLQVKLVEYYMPVIDQVYDEVAKELYTEQYDDRMNFCYE